MTIVQLIEAPCWWVLAGEPGAWRRFPLIAFALVEDGPAAARYVVGLEAGVDVELAREGTYVHASSWRRCSCTHPKVEEMDRSFCAYCGALVGLEVRGA